MNVLHTYGRILLPALVLAILASCSKSDKSSKVEPPPQQTKENAAVGPDIITFAAADENGTVHQSSEWIGKGPVVINFWATWCGPCRNEIPDLVRVYDEYKAQGVQLISLAVNDNPDRAKEYASRAGMNWVRLMAADQILIDYKATTGIPTTIFLDKNGHEVSRFVGMQGYDDFKQAFAQLVATSAS